jgi:hypothetical protein
MRIGGKTIPSLGIESQFAFRFVQIVPAPYPYADIPPISARIEHDSASVGSPWQGEAVRRSCFSVH